jgi:hypothetical protein
VIVLLSVQKKIIFKRIKNLKAGEKES